MTSTQAEILTLRDGDSEVDIAPSIGGSLAGYRWRHGARQIDWLRPAMPGALGGSDAGKLAGFPLVPYSNRVRGGRFPFRGQAIALPADPATDPHFLHGHGRCHPWTVTELDRSSAV